MCLASASLYEQSLVPWLVHGACSFNIITRQRKRIVPSAEGVVVDVGIGSGLNLPHYDPARVQRVIGIDVNPTVATYGRQWLETVPFDVEVVEANAESMPLDDRMADTVVVTYALCSIADARRALHEIRRVLKPSGRLLFCEHGRADRVRTAKWQDRVNPVWRRLSGGCNLNRDTPEMIREAGFCFTSLDRYPLPMVPRMIGFHYVGAARPS